MRTEDPESLDRRVKGAVLALAIIVLLTLARCDAEAQADDWSPASADQPSTGYGSRCLMIWSDFFPAPIMDQQYGPGVVVEMRVDICDHWRGRAIVVFRRFYREYTEGSKLVQKNVIPWQVARPGDQYVIEPFILGEKAQPLP